MQDAKGAAAEEITSPLSKQSPNSPGELPSHSSFPIQSLTPLERRRWRRGPLARDSVKHTQPGGHTTAFLTSSWTKCCFCLGGSLRQKQELYGGQITCPRHSNAAFSHCCPRDASPRRSGWLCPLLLTFPTHTRLSRCHPLSKARGCQPAGRSACNLALLLLQKTPKVPGGTR